jgi:hypothetical protein
LKTIPKLINTIQNLGYSILLDGDKIKLKFIGKDDPPKEASAVINEIKGNKAIVIEYLKNISKMNRIFKKAVNEICKVYKEYTISYVSMTFPKTYEKGMHAENNINHLWDEGKDIKAFYKAVREWKNIQIKFIELLNAKKSVDTVMDDVYNPPNGKPGPSQGLGKETEEHGTL